ncbi:hypothetical protein Acor_32110 [Acrocarpospora corrugata]|uniref:Uncharacterized protein n=1 Tax=Acrocarpospora corrugata TaxID=35763 RepID=A0A5M3VWD0_9ACTN|nr:hypothetical protein Acor_32110 [Acrocarpospora corrugata]
MAASDMCVGNPAPPQISHARRGFRQSHAEYRFDEGNQRPIFARPDPPWRGSRPAWEGVPSGLGVVDFLDYPAAQFSLEEG